MIFIDSFLCLLCLSATYFYSYAIYAAKDLFSCAELIKPDFHPPISILKPICGLDRETYQNLASFCCQDYPEYQIIFAVRDPLDPAMEVLEKIIYNFPNIDIQIVVDDASHQIYPNLKVKNLANAAVKAKHSILLMADSDIRVKPDYLGRVVQPLIDPKVGVVTCLYRSLTEDWLTTIEALGITTEFHPRVLVARKLEGMKFAMGSTIAIRKKIIEEIGGFGAIADYLADDYLLGSLPAQAGYEVVLSNYIVDHVLSASNLADSIKRQTRWNRGMRVSRPNGYLGLIFTYGTISSLLFLIATGGTVLGWIVVAIAWITRLVMAYVVGVIYLQDSVTKKVFWFLPVWDLISFILWCYSFVGNNIEWRGQRLKLTKGGKLLPLI